MPPVRGRKRKSTASAISNSQDLAQGALIMAFSEPGDHVTPPVKNIINNRMRISPSQKQALIDNLQLEVTERARKMRAQYTLQAQGLKTRLEIRVHRIPAALRNTTIAELLAKYSDQANIKSASSEDDRISNNRSIKTNIATTMASSAGIMRGSKRKSDDLDDAKENAVAGTEQKKRVRAEHAEPVNTDIAANRRAVRRVATSQILSPKSNNSRSLPYPPLKSTSSPVKSILNRPVSPLKPSVTAPTATSLAKTAGKPSKAKTGGVRAASKQDKRTAVKQTRPNRAAPPSQIDEDNGDRASRASNVSNAASSSAGTTIVRTTRKTKAPLVPSIAPKGKVAGVKAKFEGISGTGRKVTTTKASTPASTGVTIMGGRSLRKRP